MKRWSSLPAICLVSIATSALAQIPSAPPPEPPTDWIDPATGHRIVRLSKEPGSASLYFHQNAYTPDGNKLIISTPGGLSSVNLKTHEIEPVVPNLRYGMGSSSGIEVGRKTPTVYYQRVENGATTLYGTDINSKETRAIARVALPGADLGGVNADETLIVGKGRTSVSDPQVTPTGARRGGGGGMLQFFIANIKSGEVKTFFPMSENLNHHQSSPTDPNLILYCHEGNWHEVDRIWTIHTDGTGNKLMHLRTMEYEIAGHEFFSHDGNWVYYDLQTPRSAVFWLAGVNVYSGERIRYLIERQNWSVHFNESWDGKLFAGDGGGPNSVANRTPLPEGATLNPPQNGQWIFLFTPQNVPTESIQVNKEEVKIGKLKVERLVDLSKHNYQLEPNLTFTPDNKWIVFRSNLHGAMHVYAVEVAKAK